MTPLLTPQGTDNLQHIRGIRNNNPLNLRYSCRNGWLGQVGSDEAGFCRFSAMCFGFRAAFLTLRTYHKKHQCRTLRDYISRWAPPTENPTEDYIRTVASLAGVLPEIPQASPVEEGSPWPAIVLAMTAVESSPEATRCPQVHEALEKGYGMLLNRQLLRKA